VGPRSVGSTRRLRAAKIGALAGTLFALAVPGAALAADSASTVPLSSGSGDGQGNPLTPLTPSTPAPQTQTVTPTLAAPTTQTPTSGSSTFSGTNAIAIATGALVLIAAIGMFIWYDARKRAPVRRRAAAATAGGSDARPGTKTKPKGRKLSPAEKRRRKRGRAR
jgi:hypothetical protein